MWLSSHLLTPCQPESETVSSFYGVTPSAEEMETQPSLQSEQLWFGEKLGWGVSGVGEGGQAVGQKTPEGLHSSAAVRPISQPPERLYPREQQAEAAGSGGAPRN